MSRAKKRGLIAIGGLVLAGIGVLVAVFYGQLAHHDAAEATGGSTGGNTAEGGGDAAGGDMSKDNSCSATAAGATVYCQGEPLAPVPSDENDKAAADSLRRSDAPAGPGPWAFNVLFDDGQGLFVRSSPEGEGIRWGYLPHGGVMYVDCYRKSSFDPSPGLDYGPKWFKVHWPNAAESRDAFTSSPADPLQGWAWGYYLRPNGHNGDIPQCA